MAKRSPILGYNHNVRYRGLIFHVQTEDSGQQSPHLFTHLFFGGVIISSRKLVYDASAAEDAIKGLMQAQHKVVMKDLKRGAFDDKIDQYLGDAEGLLPRELRGGPPDEADETPRASAPEITIEPARPSEPAIVERAATDHDTIALPQLIDPDLEPALPANLPVAPPPSPMHASPGPTTSRTKTAERKSGPSKVRTSLSSSPPPIELDPRLTDDAAVGLAAAVAAANATVAAANATVKTQLPITDAGALQLDLEDPLELEPELEPGGRRRAPRDTQVETSFADGIPAAIGATAAAEGRTSEQRSAVDAASLPAGRPIVRPPSRQAMAPPQVVSRPLTEGGRSRSESDAVEVYAPAPPSAEAPPGGAPERPGQYAQHKRVSQRVQVEVVKGELSGAIPVPADLARSGRSGPIPVQPGTGPIPQRIAHEPRPGTAQPPPAWEAPQSGSAPVRASPQSGSAPVRASTQSGSAPVRASPQSGSYATPAGPQRAPDPGSRPHARSRTPTPARVSAASGPTPSRAPSSSSSGGVVMTRPAVIVGAPSKSTPPPRVRKAREEEGRGFGQGLISEKSLDEVILAYLSEDADDK